MAKKLKQLGRYRLKHELGRGAMGVVYEAHDPLLDRTVALKTIILSREMEGRDEFHKRFFLEAKAAGKLNHPNIITIYDFGEEDDLAFMAMELLKGVELRDRLAESTMPVTDALDVAQQVADGLGYAHDEGVIHRDIKPSNIMLMARGQVKIMDFGIARMRAADHQTKTGIVMGTPRYMSPEQVAGLPVDHRSDIFSLGIVLYEMLTRASLFAGEDTVQILHNVSTIEHVQPSRLNRELPQMVDFMIAKALKKDPAVRYQTAYEFAADLRTCINELGGRQRPPAKGVRSITNTVKVEVAADSPQGAPAARAIASDTRLPVSQSFDATAALQRLTAPSRRERAQLTRPPRRIGLLRRMRRDPAVRRFFITVFSAALVSGAIVFVR
jgi:eukaryotic-like serine/threonine-protein kinase